MRGLIVMSSLIEFEFEQKQIRFVGTADDPWWVAKDICDVLEISDTSQAVNSLDEDEKLTRTIYASGQNRSMWCVNESGLYSLILRSRKPQAKRFKKWVTSEVLPAIRKTGSYSVSTNLTFPNRALNIAIECLEQAGLGSNLIQSWKLDQYIKYSSDEEKLLLEDAKKLITSVSVIPDRPMNPTEVGEALARALGEDTIIKARKINLLLIKHGLQKAVQKISKKSGKKRTVYDITELGKQYGHMEVTTARYSDGSFVAFPRWFMSVVDFLANNWESE